MITCRNHKHFSTEWHCYGRWLNIWGRMTLQWIQDKVTTYPRLHQQAETVSPLKLRRSWASFSPFSSSPSTFSFFHCSSSFSWIFRSLCSSACRTGDNCIYQNQNKRQQTNKLVRQKEGDYLRKTRQQRETETVTEQTHCKTAANYVWTYC